MNTNGQILNDVNSLLDQARKIRELIKLRKDVISSLSGGNQREVKVSIDGIYLSVTDYNRSYTYSPKKNYSTAITFIKKGLNMEISDLEFKLEQVKDKLNTFNIGDMI